MSDDTDATELVLHQYDQSPYAAKVRMVLGIKNVAWRACSPPVVAPKPDLTALTGGYRRVPVLQIGADIYCDSELIIRTLDRMFPLPPLHADGANSFCFALAPWFDHFMTDVAVPLAFRHATAVDPAFALDREVVMGRPFVDLPAWQAAVPHALDSFRAQLGWINAQLADGRPWLGGDAAGLLDVFAYPVIGFLRACRTDTSIVDRLAGLAAWEARVQALGNTSPRPIGSGLAIEIAQRSVPIGFGYGTIESEEPTGLETGRIVQVRAADYGREPVIGILMCASAQHVTIERVDARAGRVAVHFPRSRFVVEMVGADAIS